MTHTLLTLLLQFILVAQAGGGGNFGSSSGGGFSGDFGGSSGSVDFFPDSHSAGGSGQPLGWLEIFIFIVVIAVVLGIKFIEAWQSDHAPAAARTRSATNLSGRRGPGTWLELCRC